MNILMTVSFECECIRATISTECLYITLTRGVCAPVHEHKALFRPSLSFQGRGSEPNSSAELRMS